MNRSHIEAMSNLRQVNPLESALSWWSRAEEDALLATLLADETPNEPVRSDVVSALSGQHRRLALIGLGVLALGAVALGLDLADSGAPGAYAAWTATTTTPSASQLTAAASSCQHNYSLGLGLLGRRVASTLPASLPQLVLTDSRGPFEMLVFAGSSGELVCLWDSSGVFGVTGGNGETLPPASDDSIGVPGVGFDRNGGAPLTYAYGLVGSRVTGVTLDLANGVHVEATVQNGFYAAWWPSRTDVSATGVTTSEGVHHQGFGDIGPNN